MCAAAKAQRKAGDTATLRARASFQGVLDRSLPGGAYCVDFVVEGGRLRPTGVEFVCGRLLCSGARRVRGRWRYELLIDPRTRASDDLKAHRIWIEDLTLHEGLPGVWEAHVVGPRGDPARMFRFIAEPAAPRRPTPEMRDLVTETHREVLDALRLD